MMNILKVFLVVLSGFSCLLRGAAYNVIDDNPRLVVFAMGTLGGESAGKAIAKEMVNRGLLEKLNLQLQGAVYAAPIAVGAEALRNLVLADHNRIKVIQSDAQEKDAQGVSHEVLSPEALGDDLSGMGQQLVILCDSYSFPKLARTTWTMNNNLIHSIIVIDPKVQLTSWPQTPTYVSINFDAISGRIYNFYSHATYVSGERKIRPDHNIHTSPQSKKITNFLNSNNAIKIVNFSCASTSSERLFLYKYAHSLSQALSGWEINIAQFIPEAIGKANEEFKLNWDLACINKGNAVAYSNPTYSDPLLLINRPVILQSCEQSKLGCLVHHENTTVTATAVPYEPVSEQEEADERLIKLIDNYTMPCYVSKQLMRENEQTRKVMQQHAGYTTVQNIIKKYAETPTKQLERELWRICQQPILDLQRELKETSLFQHKTRSLWKQLEQLHLLQLGQERLAECHGRLSIQLSEFNTLQTFLDKINQLQHDLSQTQNHSTTELSLLAFTLQDMLEDLIRSLSIVHVKSLDITANVERLPDRFYELQNSIISKCVELHNSLMILKDSLSNYLYQHQQLQPLHLQLQQFQQQVHPQLQQQINELLYIQQLNQQQRTQQIKHLELNVEQQLKQLKLALQQRSQRQNLSNQIDMNQHQQGVLQLQHPTSTISWQIQQLEDEIQKYQEQINELDQQLQQFQQP